MSISADLGETKEVQLPQGTIRYRERGAGEPIIFVHGVLVNGDHWRKVVPLLADEFHCITPDWPLGAHEVALKSDAKLTPLTFVTLVDNFLGALGLKKVTLVGNDTGGALCQMVVAERPERVERLVLTTCDAYDNFPPRVLKYATLLAHLPGAIFFLAQSQRFGVVQRMVFRLVAKHPVAPAILDSYAAPALRDAGVRADLTKGMCNASTKYTLAAARKFGNFEGPVLIAWTPDDTYWFPWKYAERLRDAFPNSRLERIEDSRVFSPEDQPERLAELITAFMRETKEAAV